MKTTNSPCIFIVEDDMIYREIIKNELAVNNFYNVELFSTGQECLDNLHKMPDIALLDFHLEGAINGVQVLRRIKGLGLSTQVIMLSSQDKVEVAVKSLKNGAYDYIIKNDVAMNKMIQRIRKINKYNILLSKRRKFNKIKKIVAIGVGIVLLLVLILSLNMSFST